MPRVVCAFTLALGFPSSAARNHHLKREKTKSEPNTPPCYLSFQHFTKGNNFYIFLCAFLDNEALLKWVLLLKERICSLRVQTLLFNNKKQEGHEALNHSPEYTDQKSNI